MNKTVISSTENSAEGVAFLCDTLCSIKVFERCRPEVIWGAFDISFALESQFSRYNSDSEISKINSCGGRCTVSSRTAELLSLSLQICELTASAFNITAQKGIPSVESGFKLDGTTVFMADGARLDLGAIAKGYIADAAADHLRDCGVRSAILDFGGNVVVIGTKTSGACWKVGIRDPNGDRTSVIASVNCSDCSVVTSAEYERGKHIINPVTGESADSDCLSASVVCSNSAIADALSTSLFVGGEELLNSIYNKAGFSFEALIIKKTGRVIFTPGLEGKLSGKLS